LIIALVAVIGFSMTVVGCDNGSTSSGGGEKDTWTKVTSLSQVDGTWKAPTTITVNVQGMKITQSMSNYTVTFNAAAKTMTTNGSATTTISGGNINELWPDLKEDFRQPGATVTFNDAKHSITIVYNNYSIAVTDATLTSSSVDFQVNQDGTKLKVASGFGFDVIYTKDGGGNPGGGGGGGGGGASGGNITGTWVGNYTATDSETGETYTYAIVTITFTNGNWNSTIKDPRSQISDTPLGKGTYTTNNGTLTSTVTEVYGDFIDMMNNTNSFDSRWYSVSEAANILGITEAKLQESGPFFIPNGTRYSVNGNSLIFTFGSSSITFTKK
jgi:uncharacterized lipoprotein NlpE involved in copper resistance